MCVCFGEGGGIHLHVQYTYIYSRYNGDRHPIEIKPQVQIKWRKHTVCMLIMTLANECMKALV